MGLRKVDLNLFALFDALMRHQSVSAASRELNVTPSAVSHGLARLRKLIGEELFTASPNGMKPTPRALELAPDIRAGLNKFALALTERDFDPALSTRMFVIAVTDLGGTVIVPELMRRIIAQAPTLQLAIFPCNRLDVAQQLDEGRVDVAMGWFQRLPREIARHTLMDVGEAIVVRPGHPLTEDVLTRERLLSYPHAVVELTGSEQHGQDGFFDDRGVVRRIWLERLLIETGAGSRDQVGRVAITVPRYHDIPFILLGTDLVATLPRQLATRAAELHGLVVLDLPYEPLVISYEMIWHERVATDPGASWLIEQLKAVASDLSDQQLARC